MRPSRAGIAFGAVLLALCIGCQREEPAGKPGPQPGAADAQKAVAEALHKRDCICDQCLITRWRSRKLSVEQAEQEIKQDMAHPLFQAEWKRFVAKMRPGYELWFYRSPGKTWEKLMGSEGYAIFDGKRLVADFETRMN